MSYTMMYILAIIVVAGAVGGFAGHLANLFPEPTPPKTLLARLLAATEGSLADILIGVVAAFCVPVILHLTKPELIDKITADKYSPDVYLLYFAGCCLAAAYVSRTFLQSVLNQVIKKVQLRQMETEDRLTTLEREVKG